MSSRAGNKTTEREPHFRYVTSGAVSENTGSLNKTITLVFRTAVAQAIGLPFRLCLIIKKLHVAVS